MAKKPRTNGAGSATQPHERRHRSNPERIVTHAATGGYAPDPDPLPPGIERLELVMKMDYGLSAAAQASTPKKPGAKY
jgi:hypothetical protein